MPDVQTDLRLKVLVTLYSWEPRSNIDADDLVAEFEAKKLKPKKMKRTSGVGQQSTRESSAT